MLSTGNIIYDFSTKLRDKPKEQKRELIKALKKYLSALKIDDSNAYAVIGVANILAETGMVKEAKDMYRTLLTLYPTCANLYANLGHIEAAEG